MAPVTRALLTGSLALAVLIGASGCGGGDDTKPAAKPTSTPSSTTATPFPPDPLDSLTPSGPTTGLPSDFPTADVPLVGKSFDQPLGPGSGPEGKKGWVLQVDLTQDPDSCFEQAALALTEHGYVEQPGETSYNGTREAQFIGKGYAVIISASPGDSGGCRLGYEVGQVHK